jgi:NDP-sugar pyrophosphorylase family protein
MTIPVVVLAGGLGLRLRDITGDRYPKPMVPITVGTDAYPFLEFPLAHLYSQGVRDVLICVGHLGHQIRDHFGNGGSFGMRIRYDDAGSSLTATRLQRAMRLISSPEVLVVCGDVYHPLTLDDFLASFHHAPQWLIQLAVYMGPTTMAANVGMDENRAVTQFGSDSVSGTRVGVESGILALRPQALADLDRGGQLALTDDVYPRLIGKGALGAFPTDVDFFDIGTPEGYRRFSAHAAAHKAVALSQLR